MKLPTPASSTWSFSSHEARRLRDALSLLFAGLMPVGCCHTGAAPAPAAIPWGERIRVVHSVGAAAASPVSVTTLAIPCYAAVGESSPSGEPLYARGSWNSTTREFRPWRGLRLRRSEIPFLVGPFDAGIARPLDRSEFVLGDEVDPRIAEVAFRIDDERSIVQKGYYSAADRVLYVPFEKEFGPIFIRSVETHWNNPNRVGGWIVLSYLPATNEGRTEGRDK